MADSVVAIARSWIGTPYVHQASVRGAGTDCLGLVRGIWREIYGCEPEVAPAYTPDWGEVGGRDLLLDTARRLMVELAVTDPLVPGQMLLFRMRQGAVAKHLGVLARGGPAPQFIHAYDGHGVTESPLTAPWARRIAARFRFPDSP